MKQKLTVSATVVSAQLENDAITDALSRLDADATCIDWMPLLKAVKP
jgi:hypothetical protein